MKLLEFPFSMIFQWLQTNFLESGEEWFESCVRIIRNSRWKAVWHSEQGLHCTSKMCAGRLPRGVSHKSHKKNASQLRLGLGTGLPFHGHLVKVFDIAVTLDNSISPTFLLIRKNVELRPAHKIFFSDITVDVLKSNNAWQVVATIFFETFGSKSEDFIESLSLNISLAKKYSNSSTLNNLTIVNNLANASVTINIPTVSKQRLATN